MLSSSVIVTTKKSLWCYLRTSPRLQGTTKRLSASPLSRAYWSPGD